MGAAAPPWRLVVIWATGADTTLDGVFRVQALRRVPGERGGAGAWERFDRWCDPFPESERERATARMLREYGVRGADLAGAPGAEAVFGELAAFLDGGPVLTVDQRGFEAWYARLRPGVDHATAFRACFPGGSITGAPKKRAREIIAELEPGPRGLYTGALGWFGFNGESQFSIAIRTVAIEGGEAHFHVGSGIVADSLPEAEWQETLDKAAGILLAAERV